MLTVPNAECRRLVLYAECHYAECHYAFVIVLSVIMLSVVCRISLSQVARRP
jgi:hypothetical protein